MIMIIYTVMCMLNLNKLKTVYSMLEFGGL